MFSLFQKSWRDRPINRKKTGTREYVPPQSEKEETIHQDLSSIKTLEELEDYMNKLSHSLKTEGIKTVFSSGPQDAKLMVIGEAPGEEENRLGMPFVGASGQLFNNMLKAIGINREDVYVTNLVPWRPPQNRTPTQEEIDFFRPILEKHIECKKPSYIFLLGAVAMKAVLGNDLFISKVRGKVFHRDNMKVVSTFHPSYILRMPKQKVLVLEDLQALRRTMDEV